MNIISTLIQKPIVPALIIVSIMIGVALILPKTPTVEAVSAPECADGIDNDGDGGIDALVELSANSGGSKSWNTGSPFTLRGFVNDNASKFGYSHVPSNPSSALLFDQATAQKVCQIAGFSTVASKGAYSSTYGRSGWHGAGDNGLTYWNGHNFVTGNGAALGNTWLTSLTCTDRLAVCEDGIDNDGDGQIDFPNDTGCASARDDSEKPHDLECTDPGDDSEDVDPTPTPNPTPTPTPTPQCSDGVDNDNDGFVDINDSGCHTDGDAGNPVSYDPNDDRERTRITPTPNPTPTPTPNPTPTPTPGPEEKSELTVTKSDSRTITRPGHSLTYVITVKNTGEKKIEGIEVKELVPSALTITSVSHNGDISPTRVLWTGIVLSEGESISLTLNATVKEDVANGHVIRNIAQVKSETGNVATEVSDTTIVERLPEVAGAVVEASNTQSGVSVPVSAKTGAGSALALVSVLLGGGGLMTVIRKGLL